jgi:hypothetical protein
MMERRKRKDGDGEGGGRDCICGLSLIGKEVEREEGGINANRE